MFFSHLHGASQKWDYHAGTDRNFELNIAWRPCPSGSINFVVCWTHPAKDSCHPKNRFIGVLGVVMALKFPVLTWIGAPVHRRNRNGFNIDFAAVVESKQAKGCKKHGLYLWCLVVWKWRFDASFRAVETLALLSGTCRFRVCVSFLHWNYWQYIVLITFMFYFQKKTSNCGCNCLGIIKISYSFNLIHNIAFIWYTWYHIVVSLFWYSKYYNQYIPTVLFPTCFCHMIFFNKPSKPSHRTTILGRLLRNYPASWRNRIETCMGDPCQWPVTGCSEVDIFPFSPEGAIEFLWHRQSHHKSHL